MVAVNLTCGTPFRSPEMLELTHRNGKNNEIRSIHISEGRVAITGVYKGYIVHRFLPRSLGVLIAQYLLLVQPLVDALQQHLGLVDESGPWIWQPTLTGQHYDSDDNDENPRKNDEEENFTSESGLWDCPRMRLVSKDVIKDYLHIKMTLSEWNHTQKALSHEYSHTNPITAGLHAERYPNLSHFTLDGRKRHCKFANDDLATTDWHQFIRRRS